MARCRLFLHLFCLLLSELSESVIWYLTLIWGEILNYYYFKYFFCSFIFVFPRIPITYMLYILQFSHSPWRFCSAFFSLSFPFFLVFKESINISSSSEVLFSSMFSLLMSPLTHSLFMLQWFLSLAFIFDSFLVFPSLCYSPPILAFCLLTHQSPQNVNYSCFKFPI